MIDRETRLTVVIQKIDVGESSYCTFLFVPSGFIKAIEILDINIKYFKAKTDLDDRRIPKESFGRESLVCFLLVLRSTKCSKETFDNMNNFRALYHSLLFKRL